MCRFVAVGIVVFLCVVRSIDQLSDGKVDLLVLVSTGRTVQCKLLTDVFDSGRTEQVQTSCAVSASLRSSQ